MRKLFAKNFEKKKKKTRRTPGHTFSGTVSVCISIFLMSSAPNHAAAYTSASNKIHGCEALLCVLRSLARRQKFSEVDIEWVEHVGVINGLVAQELGAQMLRTCKNALHSSSSTSLQPSRNYTAKYIGN